MVTEIAGRERLPAAIQQRHIVEAGRHQHHGLSLKQRGTAIFEAGKLRTGHGVTAHKGEAVFFRKGKAAAADLPLDAAAVNDKGILRNQVGVLFQPACAAIGVDGKQNQITFRDGFLTQLAVNSPGQHSKGQHLLIALNGVDGVSGDCVGSGQTAADETQPQDTDFHAMASRTF